MDILKAEPESLETVFSRYYMIPDYQRPYSWDKEECEQLWDDIYNGYCNNKSNEYFLGNIVVYKNDLTENCFDVIDGQQRLTSLSLLIKAFHLRSLENKGLPKLLFKNNTLTDEIDQNEPRIGRSHPQEHTNYFNVIKATTAAADKNNKFLENYKIFAEKIEKFLQEENGTTALTGIIEYLYKKVKLITIKCNDLNDALNIFDTLNNRGIPLNNNDIFKAKLYQLAENKKDFIKKWDDLIEFENTEFKNTPTIFNQYMIYKRAEEKEDGFLTALRQYFKEFNYNETMNYLDKFQNAHNFFSQLGIKEQNLINSLEYYPNKKPLEPIYIFLIKNLNISNGSPTLSYEKQDKFNALIKQMVRYAYIKGLEYNSVSAIKHDIVRFNIAIYHNNDYLNEIKKKIGEQEIKGVISKLTDNAEGKYKNGIIFLNSILHEKQNKVLHEDTLEIEHIMPKKFFNQDGFSKEDFNTYKNNLGNLTTLESTLNKGATNKAFIDKKPYYAKSDSCENKDLSTLSKWNKEAIEIRKNNIIGRLKEFFEG